MGWTPAQVGGCTLWEFMAALDGYGNSKGWKGGSPAARDPLDYDMSDFEKRD